MKHQKDPSEFGIVRQKHGYSSRKRATSRADRLDNEYGGYRYSVRLVHPQDTNKEITPAEKAKLGNK